MAELNRTNEYSVGLRRLDEERLREYVKSPDNFHDEAVLAAIWELSRRRPLEKDEIMLESSISERLKPQKTEVAEVYTPVFRTDEADIPSLYSIRSIQIFSVLFSVIGGGILMAINFSRTTQKAEAVKVIGFSIAYTFLSVAIISILGTQSPILTIVLNLLGAFLINELFWKRVLGLNFRFKKQQLWSALLVAFVLITPIVWYAYKAGLLPNM